MIHEVGFSALAEVTPFHAHDDSVIGMVHNGKEP